MARKKIKIATDQRPFVMIYQDFLESDVLQTHYQKLVYIYLKKFANSKNQCFPSVKTLSELTKISITKLKSTLEELEELGVIAKENRSREDGGKTSNLYTLYDYAELWNVDCSSSEKIVDITDKINETKMVAELRARGYVVNKEKELDHATPTKVIAESSSPNQLNQLYIDNNILNTNNSQVRYTLDDIRDIYDYNVMTHDYPEQKKEIDSVMDILYDILNTSKKTIRVSGDDKPTMVVVSKLLKLDYQEIIYCIQKYQEQTEKIKNPKSYMLTLLYGAREQMRLDMLNQVNME